MAEAFRGAEFEPIGGIFGVIDEYNPRFSPPVSVDPVRLTELAIRDLKFSPELVSRTTVVLSDYQRGVVDETPRNPFTSPEALVQIPIFSALEDPYDMYKVLENKFAGIDTSGLPMLRENKAALLGVYTAFHLAELPGKMGSADYRRIEHIWNTILNVVSVTNLYGAAFLSHPNSRVTLSTLALTLLEVNRRRHKINDQKNDLEHSLSQRATDEGLKAIMMDPEKLSGWSSLFQISEIGQ